MYQRLYSARVLRLLSFFLLCLFFSSQLCSQNGGLKAIGGTGATNWNDVGYAIGQNPDGTFMLAGYSESGFIYDYNNNISDAYLVKLNTDGSILWGCTVGESYNLDPSVPEEEAHSLVCAADGGYVVAGRHFDPSGGTGQGYQVYVAKVNGTGTSLQWARHVGGANNEDAWGVIQTDDDLDGSFDDGYLIAGNTVTYPVGTIIINPYFVKLDANGGISWTRIVGIGSGGTANADEAFSVVQNADGTYLAVGYTGIVAGTTAGSYDILLIKLNANGSAAWLKTIGGDGDDRGYSIAKTNDGGYILCGETASTGTSGSSDVYIAKLNADATVAWDRRVGGASADIGRSVMQTSDGSYLIGGYTNSYGEGGGNDAYAIKLTATGTVAWTRTVGTGVRDRIYGVMQTNDNGVALTGYRGTITSNNCDMLFIKLDMNGDLSPSCTKNTGGANSVPGWSSVARAIGENTTGNSTGTGSSLSSGGSVNTTCGTISVLPVEILSFTGMQGAGQVLLQWQTAMEINNDRFTIERSADGNSWTAIGTVPGNGTTSYISDYSFIDKEPGTQVSGEQLYYRLRQTDHNGMEEIFPPIFVHFYGSSGLALYFQNSVTDLLQGTLLSSYEGKARIELQDVQGRLLRFEEQYISEGANPVMFELQDCRQGVYNLVIRTDQSVTHFRFVRF